MALCDADREGPSSKRCPFEDEHGRRYVRNPARQENLEPLRERSPSRELGEYAEGKGRLRTFRTKAVRAGFKRTWVDRDYRTIVRAAERLLASALQEDARLLMYYGIMR